MVADVNTCATFIICSVINCHQDFFSLHLFETSFLLISLLYSLCYSFSLINGLLLIITVNSKVFLLCLCQLKCVISFEIQKQNISNVPLITKCFVCLMKILCLTFDVFRRWAGGLRGKRLNDITASLLICKIDFFFTETLFL